MIALATVSFPIEKAIRLFATTCLLLTICQPAKAVPNQTSPSSKASDLRLLLYEDRPGSMASEQYCLLVFADHRFHAEKAIRRLGRDQDRNVYEGQLSDNDWNTLSSMIDSDGFRKLNVPRNSAPPVVQDAHTYAISVARNNSFQNMEFLDNKSRKPYEAQLKPLLQWWKSVRGRHMTESGVPDNRCAATSAGTFTY